MRHFSIEMGLRGLEYTPRKRACIVALHEEGLSIREIAAKGHGKKSGIANVIKRYASTGQTTPKKRCGRPRISSGRADRVLSRLAISGRFKGSTELATDWFEATGTNASSSTVRRRLITDGLKSYCPAKKPNNMWFLRFGCRSSSPMRVLSGHRLTRLMSDVGLRRDCFQAALPQLLNIRRAS